MYFPGDVLNFVVGQVVYHPYGGRRRIRFFIRGERELASSGGLNIFWRWGYFQIRLASKPLHDFFLIFGSRLG